MRLIRTLDTNPAFIELRKLFKALEAESYEKAARRLYTNPEEADTAFFKGERRYWQGIHAVLAAPAAQTNTRGDQA